MKFRRGDVVLVDFPFADGLGSKLRPAVVVQNNRDNVRLATTIVVAITSNLRHQMEATQVLLDPNTHEGGLAGVLRLSVIKCETMGTVHDNAIQRKIGVLSANHLVKLNGALKAALETM